MANWIATGSGRGLGVVAAFVAHWHHTDAERKGEAEKGMATNTPSPEWNTRTCPCTRARSPPSESTPSR